jgi:lipoate-protein ligase B
LVAARRAGEVVDTLVLVEHEPVYTLGRNAKKDSVLASEEELARVGITVVKTGRGGDATYHGPGQIVAYPIIDLDDWGHGVLQYVTSIEEVIIRTLAEYGINGTRNRRNRGVWVADEKIAAIGVRVTAHVTMHGFCLNVCVDLDAYAGIVPCGMKDKGVTSMHRLVPTVTLPPVKETLVEQFVDVFGYENGSGDES